MGGSLLNPLLQTVSLRICAVLVLSSLGFAMLRCFKVDDKAPTMANCTQHGKTVIYLYLTAEILYVTKSKMLNLLLL
jgi:hypothetical protein